MNTKTKLVLLFTLFSLAWFNYCRADLVITKEASPPEDIKQGYVENSDVYFSVTNGQSVDTLNTANSRSMRRVELELNGKKIVIQNSGDKELYINGQDQFGGIVTLEKNDYWVIRHALKNLAGVRKGKTVTELHEAVSTALNLLATWPNTMPLLIWQDDKQRMSAVDKNSVISQPLDTNGSTGLNQAKPINKSILDNPNARLQLPEIEPLLVLPLQELTPKSAAAPKSSQAIGASSSNSSKSLCAKMGAATPGTYPLITSTFSFPFVKVKGWEKYTATVGGVQCLARCGGGCVDSISGVNGLGKNAYSEDCLDHDMCVGKRGNSGYCNFIFSDAANDFFSTPCGHDLVLENVVVSNNPIATSQVSALSAKQNLFVIFTVKNKAGIRLPHRQIFFDINLDGKKKTTLQLARVLNAFDSGRYFYQIGTVNSYKAGKHTVGIQMKSTGLIQTKTANDVVSPKSFNLF